MSEASSIFLPGATVQRSAIVSKSAVILLARVLGFDGAPLQQGGVVSSISCKVFDRATGVQTATLSPNVDDVIFDTLQTTDGRWTEDSIGYNFAMPINGTAFPDTSTYRVEVKITPAMGSPFFVLWDLQTTLVFSQ